MKKRILILVSVVLFVAAVLFGTWFFVLPATAAMSDEDYSRLVDAQTIWQNSMDDRIALTEVYHVMVQHMLGQEGEQPRKLLFIVYDGALASSAGMRAAQYPDSPIGTFAARGNLWLSFAGGAVSGDQTTDTSAGFASMFTGVWADQNGVVTNSCTLLPETRTILHRLHTAGMRARFSFSWRAHGSVNYRLEAEESPALFDFARTDAGTVSSMLEAIENGYDAIFGSLEHTDRWGHITGFHHNNPFYRRAFATAEADAARLIAAAQVRAQAYGEDWLIIIASDHGGIGTDHGGTSLMENTTWFASNQAIF